MIFSFLLKKISDKSMPPRTPYHRINRIYWWIQKIKILRTECLIAITAYRLVGWWSGPVSRDKEREVYVRTRKKNSKTIKSSKENCWRELCDAVDSDPWGLPYRIDMKKLSRTPPGLTVRGRESKMADHLFPSILWLVPHFQKKNLMKQ